VGSRSVERIGDAVDFHQTPLTFDLLLAYEDAFKLALYSLKNSLIDEDFEAGDLGQTFESGRNVNRIADHGELHSLFRANVAETASP